MTESRRQSVCFTAMPPGVLVNESPTNSTDDIQIALAPHIQSYLSLTGRRHSCCSVMLPVAFERAAAQSWMDPKFDSPVLEGQFKTSVFPHIRMRYRFTLFYILLCLITWFLYFVTNGGSEDYWRQISSSLAILSSLTILALCFTHGNMYRSHTIATSAITALTICAASLIFLGCTGSAFSPLGHFAICLEIILLIYTALPMKLWLSTFIAIVYSILFETLTHLVGSTAVHGSASGFSYKILILRILLQCCTHLVGMHVLVMNVVRMRGTFMKVGQNLLVRRQLEMEKQLKEKMIHSVMPPKVADMLLNEVGVDSDGLMMSPDQTSRYMRPRVSNDVKSLFRPFHMHSMDNVSILFADIVGFTKMSSTKTAEQLVEILNDLFERFDELCTINGCEKISTLGDCYYCVSGCPEPRPDHAICCVEMGLGMIDTIQDFDSQDIKMRVGVHTGTVLCGIVGTRRVKFDVWSNDVTLANKMESSGKPKQVHISEETSNFLGDAYILEEGEEIFGHRTFFVVGRRKDMSANSSLSPSTELHALDCGSNNFLHPQISHRNSSSQSQSTTNLSDIHPKVPPASPIGQSNSLNPSPLLSIRPRLTSISMKIRKKSHPRESDAKRNDQKQHKQPPTPEIVVPKRQHPKIIITTKSLPGSLESEDQEDQDGCCRGSNIVTPKPRSNPDEEARTKFKSKLRSWRIPNFLKKIEDMKKSSSTLVADASTTGLMISKDSKAGVVSGDCDSPANGKNIDDVVLQVEQNGYQQLPVLIETAAKSSWNKLDIPNHKSINISPNSMKSPDGSCCSPGQHSMFDDVIDIRSYISQSRSDISPFGRTGSYRSQCGRSGQSEASPIGRPRASTLIVDHRTVEVTETTGLQPLPPATITQSRNIIWPDGLSICPSATSRKDSGIKSNSRRSSIQQQIFALNQSTISQHRVSGYFTSSTSSVSNIVDVAAAAVAAHQAKLPQIHSIDLNAQPLIDPLAACLQHLRKQSDLQLIRCVRDNAKSQRSYLVKPPLRQLSLFFMSSQMEKEFRSKAHRFGNENETEGPPTLATPRYNTYIDIFIGIAVYLCISGSLFLMTPASTLTPSFRLWVTLFTIFTAIQVFALFLFTRQMVRRHSAAAARTKNNHHHQISQTISCADRIFESISSWYPWHICLAILMAMPVILIMVNFLLLDLNQLQAFEYHYGFLIFVCIVHFCNFTQLNCWMRNILAFLAALCFVGIAVSQLTVYSNRFDSNGTAAAAAAASVTIFTNTTIQQEHQQQQQQQQQQPQQKMIKFIFEEVKWFQDYHVEIYLDLLLILVLVWFLNREFEIGYRLTFYGNAVANQDKIRVQNMKNQADMLLHNIIPKHVAEHLKNTAKYSENHHNVGILFASIVNFNEMYDESYLGGKEYLRVLNELIGDFDELLSRPEFRCVEKIKTIGSTFMAASGLDPSNRGDNNEHIHALMEFSLEMQSVIEAFNKDLLEFNLVLRIGLNVGDVTAGVIGTSKLHYDIWGDAVNVASRMDSTGVANRIQIGKDCLPYLETKYEFEPRGKVYVKGKDDMEVFLLVGRKDIACDKVKEEEEEEEE